MTTPVANHRTARIKNTGSFLFPMFPLILTIGIRLAMLHEFAASPFFIPLGGDRGLYHDTATALSMGNKGPAIFTFMPLYPYLLGGLYYITGEPNLATAGILQAIIDGITALMLFKAARKRYGETAGLTAGCGFALLRTSAAYSLVTMPVSLGLFWTALALTISDLYLNRWTMKRSVIMGFALGVGGQLLGAFWLMIIPFGVLTAYASGVQAKISKRIANGMILIICGYACLLPSLAHNVTRGGQWVWVTAHSGLNLYIGNNPAAKGYGVSIPGARASAEEMIRDSQNIASKACGFPLTTSQADRFWRNKTLQFWRDQPVQSLKLLAHKAHRIISVKDFDDTGLCRLLPEILPLLRLTFIGFGLIWITACAGLPLRENKHNNVAIWIMGAGFAGGMLLTFVSARYRLPIAILSLPAASGTLAALPSTLKRGITFKKRLITSQFWRLPILLKFTVAIAGIVIALLPHTVPDTNLPDDLNRSGYKLQYGDTDEALRFAKRAASRFPWSDEAWFTLGNAQFSKKQYPDALEAYNNALKIAPERTDAMFNAATALSSLGRTEEARAMYEKVVRFNHNHSKAWFALALIQIDSGDTDSAMRSLTNAAKIEGWDHPQISAFYERQKTD